MVKKIIAIMLCLVVVLGCLAGCSKVENEVPGDDVTVVTPSEDEVATPDEEVTEPSEDEVVEPSEDEVVEPSEDEVVTPADVDQKLIDVFTQAQEALGEEFRANMEIPAEMYADMFGVAAEDYESVYGLMPMMSAHVDTLVGFKAVNADNLKAALDAYAESKKADRMQYPTNAAAMGAMQVLVVGDYVWLVGTFGATDTAAEAGDEAILAYAEANVAKVVEIINTVCAE